jgi:predicted ATPase
MREAIGLCREQGTLFLPNYVFQLAECEAQSGQIDTGIALVTDQLAETKRSVQRWLDAELLRRHADLLVLGGARNNMEAEATYTRALDAARQQRASVFELRSAIGLANLRRSQSKFRVARDLLVLILETWNGDRDLPEVQNAERLIQTFR